MRKILLSSLFLCMLSACNEQTDNQLSQQLQSKEQTIKKLTEELKQLKTDSLLNEDVFPSANVQIIPLFKRTDSITYPASGDEGARESQLYMFVSIAATKIDWLDNLLNQVTIQNYEKGKEHKNQFVEGKEREYLLQQLNTDYEQTLNSLKQENAETAPSGYSYSLSTEYVGQRNDLIAFVQNISTYTGGAHGNYENKYINIDIKKKAVLKLKDLFDQDSQLKLRELLWQEYINRNREQSPFTEKANFTVIDNFLLSHQGIKFIYPPYQLGPFAEGDIELTLPWQQVNDIINPDYQQNKDEGFGINGNPF